MFIKIGVNFLLVAYQAYLDTEHLIFSAKLIREANKISIIQMTTGHCPV